MVSQTVFRSDETFTQESFRLWLDERPAGDITHYELLNGRSVMTPPAGTPHGRLGDPDRQGITVYTLAAGAYDDEQTFRSGPLHSVVLPQLHLRVEDVCAPG